jgi:VWFA-related protein
LTFRKLISDIVTRLLQQAVPYQAVLHRPFFLALSLVLLPSYAATRAQNPSKPEQADEVIQVRTDLVQTDVMVFDKKGHFVDGLRPEQFKLSLDGQAHTISIFERVTSGSKLEAAQLATMRASASNQGNAKPAVGYSTSGRLIFFFVDDVHLSGESLVRARRTILHFIESRMNPGDKLAIVSTSGQIGFLQQLTDNPAVLRTAISRLNYKRNPEGYAGKTRITDYMASQIADAHNAQLFAYLMESVKIEYGMGLGAARGDHGNDSAGQARRLLKSRISQISAQSRADTANTIGVLRSLMQSSATMPGRKLIFFLSDGFVVDPRGSSALSSLRQVTQVAAHSGAVIYSIDMRGSFTEAAVDASSSDYIDMTSRHAGVSLGETMVPREPLNVLADETGGRTIVNSAGLNEAIEQAVHETSDYYVLAWRPGSENELSAKARLEVTIPGRPDLRIRLRRSYNPTANPAPAVRSARTSTEKLSPEAQLLTTLGAAQPQRALPTSLSVGYVKTNEGLLLETAMQIPREAFNFDASAKQKSEVDVIGAAIDDRGLIYTFKQVLTVIPQTNAESNQVPVIWNQQLKVKPGLYQVRVAVRERGTDRTGSAMEWIEIPALAPATFQMSSLFLGERSAQAAQPARAAGGPQPIRVDVDHRFARTSVLRFQTYVYNAARRAGALPEDGPNVWITAQVFRGSQQVITVAPARIPPDVAKGPGQLPYWSEIALTELPPGAYTLNVTATDRVGGASSSQRISFSVE